MTLYVNARLLDPALGLDAPGHVRVRDGLIAEVGPELSPRATETVVELAGAALAPALIDLRCRTRTSPAALAATARAAAAGGIGTLVLAPDSGSGLASPEDFAAIETAALESLVRLLPSALAVDLRGEMGEIGLCLRAGAAYVGDGGAPIADTRLARRVLSYASTFDAWVSLRCEEPHLARGTCASESDLAMRLGLPARPAAGERFAIERAAALAELTGARILLDRITTRDGLAALKTARARGLEIAATAPITHLVFNEVDAGGFDSRFHLEPPLRSETDRLALIDALAVGAFEAIVSDHHACTGEAKAHPFPEAEPGSANLEALLPALCTLAADGRAALLDLLRPVTSGPAELLGLEQGRLAPGAPADFVVFDPDRPVVYGRDGLECSHSTAFANRRLHGRVLLTIVGGAIIHQPQD